MLKSVLFFLQLGFFFLVQLPVSGLTPVSVGVYYGGFGGECSWEIREKTTGLLQLSGGPGLDNAFSTNSLISLSPGVYQFFAYDTGGDGWTLPNGWFQVTPQYGEGTGQMYFDNGSELMSEFTVFSNVATDLGFVEVISPVSGPGLGQQETIELKIRNFGNSAVSSFSLSYNVNGGVLTTQTINLMLLQGEMAIVAFDGTVNLSAPGTYSFSFSISLTGDSYSGNNGIFHQVSSLSSIENFPYQTDFSLWPVSQWSSSGGSQNWQWSSQGYSYCPFLFWAPGETAFHTLPALFSNQPLFLSFQWSRFSSIQPDQLSVQVSTNNQLTWTSLWSASGSILATPGGDPGNPGQFQSQMVDLSGLAGEHFFIRFAGTSGFGNNLFLDNVLIGSYPSSNIGLTSWIPAETNECSSGNTAIKVQVKNEGTNLINSFIAGLLIPELGYEFTDTFNISLGFNEDTVIQLGPSVSFNSGESYTWQAWVQSAGDVDSTNNTLVRTYFPISPVNDFPFSESFSLGMSSFFRLTASQKSKALMGHSGNDYFIKLEGDSLGDGWTGSSTGTTATQAWQQNLSFHSQAISCLVDATSESTLELRFSLKQFYVYGPKYSWFRVLVNGNPISDVNGVENHHPTTSLSDSFQELWYDLSTFAGTSFELSFQASNKWDSISRPPGNTAWLDNILIRPIPPPDLMVETLSGPVSACIFPDSVSVSATIKNNGVSPAENFGLHLFLNDSLWFQQQFFSSIPPNASFEFTFPVPLDLTEDGDYVFVLEVVYALDSVPENNSMTLMVENYTPEVVSFLTSPDTVCMGDSMILIQATPEGGFFSGPGVAGNAVFLAIAGPGSWMVSYQVVDVHGCNSTGIHALEILPGPQPDLGYDLEINYWDTIGISPGVGFSSYLWNDGQYLDTLWMSGMWLGAGVFDFWVEVSDVFGCQATDSILVEVLDNAKQELVLPQGWGIISLFIQPFIPSIAMVFQPVVSSVVIIKDINGKVFWPAFSINTIGSMVLGRGYQTRFYQGQNLTVPGIPVNPEEIDIPMLAGWNLVAYLRSSNAPIQQMLQPYVSFITIAKDGNGMIYWPALGVNTIGSMVPGRGYQIKANTGFELGYPANLP